MQQVNKYHSRFLRTRAAENVLGIFSRFNNAHKEITESWAMLEAAKKHGPPLDENCEVFVVGDGGSPRTGAIFAYYTKARVVSRLILTSTWPIGTIIVPSKEQWDFLYSV